MKAGRFITIEGGEGAGKTTQAMLLRDALAARGIDVVQTREPGGAPGAERVRQLLLANDGAGWDPLGEALLHFAARAEHLRFTIGPALERGAWVVCDRFADSTLAYQGYGQGLDRSVIEALSRLVIGEQGPDLTFILDISAEAGLERAMRREGGRTSRYEKMGLEFHERLRGGFLEIAKAEPERCVVIDARDDEMTQHQAILRALAERLGLPDLRVTRGHE